MTKVAKRPLITKEWVLRSMKICIESLKTVQSKKGRIRCCASDIVLAPPCNLQVKKHQKKASGNWCLSKLVQIGPAIKLLYISINLLTAVWTIFSTLGPLLSPILRFILRCKSDCQIIFLKKQGI